MKISEVTPGQVVRFVTKVERSSKGQEIQNVEMRVDRVSDTHITGINVNRILDGTQDSAPYRTYKITNIVPDTVWLKLDN